jgi:hypothetical protein
MSKTDDTSKLVTLDDQLDDQLDDHGALADSGLDGVNGGNLKEAVCKGTHIPNVVIELA